MCLFRWTREIAQDSVEGLHAFVTYWLATLNYMLLTGDGNYFTNIDHTGDYTTIADFMQDMYASETGWVTGVQKPVDNVFGHRPPNEG